MDSHTLPTHTHMEGVKFNKIQTDLTLKIYLGF